MSETTYGEFVGLRGPFALELNYEPYESYEVGVWVDEQGGWYLGTDSTCSCYTPFENYSREDLTGPLKSSEAVEEITSLWNDAESPYRTREDKWLTEFIETAFNVKKKENN